MTAISSFCSFNQTFYYIIYLNNNELIKATFVTRFQIVVFLCDYIAGVGSPKCDKFLQNQFCYHDILS